jgi:uncharacterized OB-fold protein
MRETIDMSEKHATAGEPGPERICHEALAQGHFRIQRCGACSRHVFFPRVLCPHCGADRLVWTTPSGRGTVYSTTVLRRKPDAGGDLNLALIDLEEGVRMMSRVEGMAPEQVRIGMPVRARIIEHNGQPLVVFAAEGAAA